MCVGNYGWLKIVSWSTFKLLKWIEKNSGEFAAIKHLNMFSWGQTKAALVCAVLKLTPRLNLLKWERSSIFLLIVYWTPYRNSSCSVFWPPCLVVLQPRWDESHVPPAHKSELTEESLTSCGASYLRPALTCVNGRATTYTIFSHLTQNHASAGGTSTA